MEVNEDTFIELLWPALIRGVRHKQGNSTAEQGKEDHPARVRNQMLNSNSIPTLDPGND